MTFALAAAGFSAWAFGSLTQDVVAKEEAVRLDPPVERFFVTHRVGWMTAFLKGATWLGSSAVLIPLVVGVGLFLILRRHDRRSALGLVIAVSGAVLLTHVVKGSVDRPRPPVAVQLVHSSGSAFPSGHTLDAAAAWETLALIASARRKLRARAGLWGSAAAVVAIVGLSRLYLGVHWLTDVLAGYAGGTFLAMSIGVGILVSARAGPTPPGGTEDVVPGEVETGRGGVGWPGPMRSAESRRSEASS